MRIIIFFLVYRYKCAEEESEITFHVTIFGHRETPLETLRRDVETFRQEMEQLDEDSMVLWNSIETRTRLCPCISNLYQYDVQ